MSAMTGAKVAITFGRGSFGSRMNTHPSKQGVESVQLLSGDDAKHDEMRNRLGDSLLRFFLGDVRDRESVAGALVSTDYAYTPAARKQVPSRTFLTEQAVRTNVVARHNFIEVAAAAGVRTETLLGREEMLKTVDRADYVRVQPLARGLARQLRVEEGEPEMAEHDEYTFANTTFNVAQTQVLPFEPPEIRQLLEV